jgi:hypothetical protein
VYPVVRWEPLLEGRGSRVVGVAQARAFGLPIVSLLAFGVVLSCFVPIFLNAISYSYQTEFTVAWMDYVGQWISSGPRPRQSCRQPSGSFAALQQIAPRIFYNRSEDGDHLGTA